MFQVHEGYCGKSWLSVTGFQACEARCLQTGVLS